MPLFVWAAFALAALLIAASASSKTGAAPAVVLASPAASLAGGSGIPWGWLFAGAALAALALCLLARRRRK